MRCDKLVCAAALMMLGAPASAQPSSLALATGAAPIMRPQLDARISSIAFTSRELVEEDYRRGLVRLRETALKQKAADGGELTPQSIAGLQARLDKLNMVRKRELRLLQRS